MTCTYCKTENPEDCVYCPGCGKPTGLSAPLEAVPAVSKSVSKSSGHIDSPAHSNTLEGTTSHSSEPELTSFTDLPGAQNTKLAQANLSRLRKNWQEATELCIAVLREAPADPAAHSLLGDIYRDQNRLDEAARWYRMALELSPNAFDRANLQKLERQINRRSLLVGTTASGSGAGSGSESLTGSLAGGTGSLMGVSPQKWLKGITVSALGFLCLFVIYLMTIPTHKIGVVPRAVSSEALVSTADNPSGAMPAAVLGGPTTLPAGEQPAAPPSASRVAGTGLPPDLGTATVPVMQPQTGASGANSRRTCACTGKIGSSAASTGRGGFRAGGCNVANPVKYEPAQ